MVSRRAGKIIQAKGLPEEFQEWVCRGPLASRNRTAAAPRNGVVADVEAVFRRPSAGAQHAGRGGAGNVFKDSDEELTRRPSNDNAIAEDDEPVKHAPATESLAQKGKNWLFGKKA